ncbi:MAG: multicomponent Na+:H+ antiporter subunit E [Candidatus Azotimanducaceae bacterium]|jgi:multicomponent Na+:H+ antiporter subunit E
MRLWIATGLKPLLFFAGLWLLLTKGELSSWVIGIIVVPFSAWLSVILFKDTLKDRDYPADSASKVQSINVLRLFQFSPFFIIQSIRGGWQTANLAIRPSMPINPGFFRYNISLQGRSARMFFMHLVSLLPGTVSARLEDEQLLIHALEMSPQNINDINLCEQQVIRLFSGESTEPAARANNFGDRP